MTMLPTKPEMDELDRLFEQASGILMRWRFKMTPADRAEYPTVFGSIDRSEKAIGEIADALLAISTELGFGILREEKPPRLFPKTYSDWVNLAMDIKEKDSSVQNIYMVNVELNKIAHPEEFGPRAVEEAKHWLMEKARELGIR